MILREGALALGTLGHYTLLHQKAEHHVVGTVGSKWVIKNKRNGRQRTQKFILFAYVPQLQLLCLHNDHACSKTCKKSQLKWDLLNV